MKSITPILALTLLAALPAGFIHAQSSPSASPRSTTAAAIGTSPSSAAATTAASPTARTDVYHVTFTHAAAGKAAALGDDLKKPDPNAPLPGHEVVFRHQEGDSWDYVSIQHMGPKATVEAVRPAPPAASRDLSDWHNDTFVNGPAWADFAKAMGIGDSATKGGIYIVSTYRAVAGHREQLEANLSEPPAPGDPAAGQVLLQHLEGGAWTFMAVVRYENWEDFVKSETSAAVDLAKNEGGWFKLREHASIHTDTLTDRLAP